MHHAQYSIAARRQLYLEIFDHPYDAAGVHVNGRWVGLLWSHKGSKFFPWADFAILSWYYSDKPNHRTLYTLKLFSDY